MRYGLVIFDCDGVLVDSERLVCRVESEHMSELGVALDPQATSALLMGKTLDQVLSSIEEKLGRALSPAWSYRLAMSVASAFVRELQPVPLVRQVLERLQRHAAPMCVASQSLLPRVRLSLRVTGLDAFFGERVYTASMVARPKPAPDLFLYAATQMGVEPSACAVIEDSPSGVTAARAAGMTVFGYAGSEEPAPLARAGARVFASMADLPELLGLD
ncbi:MAG: HAD family hydrolase [Polyangiales bacterium]